MAEASVELEPGTILVDKYRVERVLGKGGMGVVVLVSHLELEDKFAVKILTGQLDADAQLRFLREARAAAQIKSEHVARVVDVGTLPEGVPYMVMEFLEGTDLAGLIEQRGARPIPEAVELVLQACIGLTEAHARGFVHRDLKPANLFLQTTSDGRRVVKLLDFGISKATHDVSLTSTRAVLGTPAYMAPEQWRSAKEADVRSDIWSLGVVLHELLSGQRPFLGDSVPDMCSAVLAEDPPPLTIGTPALEKLVAKCLEKEPEDRYQRIPELARDLALFAADPATANALVDRMDRVAGRPSSPSLPRAATAPTAVDRPAKQVAAIAPPIAPTPRRTKTLALAVGAVMAAGATYALTRSNDSGQASPAKSSAVPQRGGTLRVGMNRADETKLALYAGQPTRTQAALRMVMERMVVLDGSGKLQPSVLAGVESRDDHKTLVLTLRPDVRFHGTPCMPEADATATDLEFSIKEAIAQRQLDFDVASTKATGLELVISLRSPVVTYAHALSHVWLIPAKLEGCERDRKDLQHPVGTGPFRWAPSPVASTLSLARWEHYWRRDARNEPLPYLDRVELVQVTEANVALAALREDVQSPRALHAFIPHEELRSKLVDSSGITPTLMGEAAGLALGTRTNQPDVGLWLLEPVKEAGPLRSHVELRRAIALAIDREAATSKGFTGASSPVHAHGRFLQPGTLGFEDGAVASLTKDHETARRLVAEVVEQTGRPIPPLRIGHSHDKKAAEAVAASLREIGLTITLASVEMREQSNVLDSDKVDAMLISRWTKVLGNELIAISAFDQQRSPEIRRLLRELAGRSSRSQRAKAYQDIEATLLVELPSIPIATLDPKRLTFAAIVRPEVEGLVVRTTGVRSPRRRAHLRRDLAARRVSGCATAPRGVGSAALPTRGSSIHVG